MLLYDCQHNAEGMCRAWHIRGYVHYDVKRSIDFFVPLKRVVWRENVIKEAKESVEMTRFYETLTTLTFCRSTTAVRTFVDFVPVSRCHS